MAAAAAPSPPGGTPKEWGDGCHSRLLATSCTISASSARRRAFPCEVDGHNEDTLVAAAAAVRGVPAPTLAPPPLPLLLPGPLFPAVPTAAAAESNDGLMATFHAKRAMHRSPAATHAGNWLSSAPTQLSSSLLLLLLLPLLLLLLAASLWWLWRPGLPTPLDVVTLVATQAGEELEWPRPCGAF